MTGGSGASSRPLGWRAPILKHFTPEIAKATRLTIVSDPDHLLTEQGSVLLAFFLKLLLTVSSLTLDFLALQLLGRVFKYYRRGFSLWRANRCLWPHTTSLWQR